MSAGTIGRFARSSAVYAFGNAIGRAGAFLLLPLYTRQLSVAQYGQLELFYVIASLASGLLSVGIAHATLRFFFEYKDPADRNALVTTNLIGSFAICALGVSLVALAAGPISQQLFGDVDHKVGIWIVLATLVFELSCQVCLALVRALERAWIFVGIACGKLVVQVALNATLLTVFDMGVTGVLLGNLVTVAVAWLLLTAFTLRHCGVHFHWSKLLPVLKYGFPFLLSTIVGLVASNADRVLVNRLLSFQALGIYALAMKFASLLTELIGEPFGQAYGAFRFSIMGQDDAGAIQAQVTRYLLVLCTFAALALSFAVEPVLRLMATAEYLPAAHYVPVLALAGVIRLLSYPTQTGIFWAKHTRHVFHLALIGAAVNVVLGFVLVWLLGITGACLTLLAKEIVNLLLTDRFSQRYFVVHYEWRRMVFILLAGMALYLASILLQGLPRMADLGARAVLLLLFLPILVGTGGISRAEVRDGFGFLRGILGKRAANS